MSGDVILALDVGTGSGRAVLHDRAGQVVASAQRGWSASSPPELAPLGREYDPEALVSAQLRVARAALAHVRSERVAAISVTGQRIGCAFEDAEGRAVYAGPNADVRAMLGADLADLDSDALYESTGRFPPWIYAPARLRWMDAHGVEVARVRSLPGLVASRLGASHVTSPSLAADLMMLDVEARSRAPLGEPSLWPRLAEPGSVIGSLSPDAAETLGLSAGLPLVLAPADTQAAVLGAGALDGGDCLVAGSSAPLVRVLDEPMRDPRGRLWLDPHVRPGRWLLEANLGEMGSAHQWLAELILGAPAFEVFDELAASAPLGCDAASAHLGPRAMDLRALNTDRPAGLLLPFGQTTGRAPPGRAQVFRAHLESCAYAARAGREWLDEVAPRPSGALSLAGGLARSDFFAQMLADVLGAVVRAAPPEASARGAAACAALALGWQGDLAAAQRLFAGEARTFTPDAEVSEDYDDAFERWQEREAGLEAF